jgi:hypothetical protein
LPPPSGLEIDSVQCDEHVSLINSARTTVGTGCSSFWGPPLNWTQWFNTDIFGGDVDNVVVQPFYHNYSRLCIRLQVHGATCRYIPVLVAMNILEGGINIQLTLLDYSSIYL